MNLSADQQDQGKSRRVAEYLAVIHLRSAL
jgi:hypothetical protein